MERQPLTGLVDDVVATKRLVDQLDGRSYPSVIAVAAPWSRSPTLIPRISTQ
jgi:hypothetical protein